MEDDMTMSMKQRKLFNDMGALITRISDEAKLSPGGDMVVLGSTNHIDELRNMQQRFFDYRCEHDPGRPVPMHGSGP